MINYFQDNSCVTPISRGVNLSTEFRGSLRPMPCGAAASDERCDILFGRSLRYTGSIAWFPAYAPFDLSFV
ncbi:hypothetical protein SH449x_005147 [Pirellulaceae bacterium SH449]